MLPRMSRRAHVTAAITLLAATVAALPSLDWCPRRDGADATCEATVRSASASASRDAMPCPGGATTCASGQPDACDAPGWPSCEVEPDPLPAGDKFWCIRPPATAIVAKLVPLDAPEASAALAVLAMPPALAPPAVVATTPIAHAPRPPTLRAAHAPPQPRAPPAA